MSKAIYAYLAARLHFWQSVRAQAKVALWVRPLPPGLLEKDLWVGDRPRLPNCMLVVSEPRLPCFKFAAAMGFAQAVKLMVQSGWCGSYLAVLHEGALRAGDPIELQPGPREVGIPELFRARARA